MFKLFESFFRFNTPVISMAIEAGVHANFTVKPGFGCHSLKNSTCNIPNADIIPFVTSDTLSRGNSSKGFVTTQTLFFQRMMSLHQRSRIKEKIRKGCSQRSKYNC